jgi:hypothetical protein
MEPLDIAEVVETYGRLVVGQEGELMVELDDKKALELLSAALSDRFGDQVLLSP